MIVTLRDHYGVEVDVVWESPRENAPPVNFIRRNRLYTRQGLSTTWLHAPVDDLSEAEHVDVRQPDHAPATPLLLEASPPATPAPETPSSTEDDDTVDLE